MKITQLSYMKMLKVLGVLLLILNVANAQKVKNEFFTLHNIIRGDSTYNTFDKQVELVKNAGYDAIEINQLESFDGMKAALDKYNFKCAFFYVKIGLDDAAVDKRLQGYIARLKGTNTIITPYIIGNPKLYKPSGHNADTIVINRIRQVADWAKEAGLQVAIYPHYNMYVEREDLALNLVKLIDRKNVGLSFNLCHWLATTTEAERAELKPLLKELLPYLKMITISGANDVVSQQKNPWDDYILPLGSGTFDTYALLKYMIRDLKYKNPIGVQCYNIKGDKPMLVQHTIAVWKTYKARLENEK